MVAEPRLCPACSAPLPSVASGSDVQQCDFCGWSSPAEQYPKADLDSQRRSNAATIPLPKDQAEQLEQEQERPADGPAQFRALTSTQATPEARSELLEQVPDEMRDLLEERMQAADEAKPQGLSLDTKKSLEASGYQVRDEPGGVRITGGHSRSPTLSPSDMVRIAAEQEGGVQHRGKLPVCPECQAVSPMGSERCQWCGAELPQQ